MTSTNRVSETSHSSDALGEAGPRPASNAETDAAVAQRRKAAELPGSLDELWGIALSGGGVRSATFCLGLLRGLATNKLLRRFDYLSTVSGGGYVGASLGRLYDGSITAKAVETAVAKDDSLWLWWLRSNGRYLTPAGAKDLGFAGASIVRGIVATHMELAMLLLVLAGLVLLPHMLVTLWAQDATSKLPIFAQFGSAWWWLAIIPLAYVLHQLFAYWAYRDTSRIYGYFFMGLAALASTALAIFGLLRGIESYRAYGSQDDAGVTGAEVAALLAFSLLLFTPLTGYLAAVLSSVSNVSDVRLRRTKKLATGLWVLTGMIVLGCLDYLSWRLTDMYWRRGEAQPAVSSALIVTAIIAIVRLALPSIKEALAKSKLAHVNIERFLNALGLVAAALAVLAWTTIFHAAMFPVDLWDTVYTPARYEPVQVLRWAVLFGVPLAYILLSCRSFDLLNLASLHNFYRGRIERAYISSGNWGDHRNRFKQHPLCTVTQVLKSDVAPLVEAVAGDDVDVDKYTPHEHGGPIHIINCCINQSVDDRTENYNADRKGVALAMSALGVEIGTQLPRTMEGQSLGPLSKWIAISGAAASTGMGSNTSPGLAALLFMSGLRLGYWVKALRPAHREGRGKPGLGRAAGAIFRWMPKPVATVAEFVARFPGLGSTAWYVSDGGHFDNTGIYSLLKREVAVIVAADCGADPKYLFSDLESLVRKAEIDYGAKIEFIDQKAIGEGSTLSVLIGTPETIGPEPASRCLVLGKICYASGKIGTLLVAKPCRLEEMPFDIVAYADRNATFPQQTTGDQFFDESQWESYHRLGRLIGGKINAETIAACVSLVASSAPATSSLSKALKASRRVRISTRRERIGSTVRASIGAGVSFSVLVALWQGYVQYQQSETAAAELYGRSFGTVQAKVNSGKLSDLDASDFKGLKDDATRFGFDRRYNKLSQALQNKCISFRAETNIPAAEECDNLVKDLQIQPPFRYWMDQRADGGRAVDNVASAPPLASKSSGSAGHASTNSQPGNGQVGAVIAGTAVTPSATSQLASSSGMIESPPSGSVPAPAPTEEPTGCGPLLASGLRLYIQVYDEETRSVGDMYAKSASKEGFRVPGIENVAATAKRLNQEPPSIWKRPTLIYHDDVPEPCRAKLIELLPPAFQSRALPTSLKSSRGVVELWLPPYWTQGPAPEKAVNAEATAGEAN